MGLLAGGWGPFQSLSDLASFIALLATVLGIVFGTQGSMRDAPREVRRCRSLQRRIASGIPEMRRRLTRVTRCLCMEEDEREIEAILFRDSNIVEELREFSEQACPDLDLELWRKSLLLGLVGVAYIAYGFLTGNYVTALFFSLLGLVPIAMRERSGYQAIRKFTLQLDEIDDKLDEAEKRLAELARICAGRGEEV